MNEEYKKERLSFLRKAVIASASITKRKNIIHYSTEVEITKPREYIKKYRSSHGVKLSFTGYIAKCVAEIVKKYPNINSFIVGRNIYQLSEIVISILLERKIGNEYVPEPLAIHKCDEKDLLQITNEIRNAQNTAGKYLGQLSNSSWFGLIPSFLLKSFVKLADKNVKMGVKYGKIAITAAGMFCNEPVWIIPHGGGTLLITIGSIINKIIEIDGKIENREHLCITISYDHDIIDGAPAARVTNEIIDEIKEGKQIERILK